MFRTTDPIVHVLEGLGINRAGATRLSRRGTVIDVAAGKVLCLEGERGSQAFLLLQGEAQVITRDAEIIVRAGEVIGELATLDPQRTRNATVITTSAARVLVFDVGTYRFLAQDAELRSRLAPDRIAA